MKTSETTAAAQPIADTVRNPWPFRQWMGGLLFTFVIAGLGYGLAQLPGPDHVGSMACSIILAVVYRQIWGYPESLRSGIEFSAKKLLRYAIVLYGLKLNVNVIFNEGLPLLARGAFTIVFAMLVMMILAKWLKADLSLSLLLGVGTGVCGASAIAAASPIIKAKEEDTAIGVGIIAFMGTVFALSYTFIRPFLPLSPADYAVWSGVSLHEIAHVALAAAPAGQDPLAIALLAKLSRVFLLIPLCFVLVFWMNRGKRSDDTPGTKTPFPWFLLGFVAMSLIGSYLIGDLIEIPDRWLSGISELSHFILTAAMVGLGLNVSFAALRKKALRPLLAMTLTSVLLSMITYLSL
ncbi:MAG TPA: putative sulfate exporter family transporter [Bacillales bacterium]|nr:putative sulfate exporter family transporter [Bacillales bacterium]